MKDRSHTLPQNPPILETENLTSATECTGLTPAAICTESQAEDYARLYAIHLQKVNTLAGGGEPEGREGK